MQASFLAILSVFFGASIALATHSQPLTRPSSPSLPVISAGLASEFPRAAKIGLENAERGGGQLPTATLVELMGIDSPWLCSDKPSSLTNLHETAARHFRKIKDPQVLENYRQEWERPAQAALNRALEARDLAAITSVALKYRFTRSADNALTIVVGHLHDKGDSVTAGLFLQGFILDHQSDLCDDPKTRKLALLGAHHFAQAGMKDELKALKAQLSACPNQRQEETNRIMAFRISPHARSAQQQFSRSWRESSGSASQTARPVSPLLKLALVYRGGESQSWFSKMGDTSLCAHLDYSAHLKEKIATSDEGVLPFPVYPPGFDRYPLATMDFAQKLLESKSEVEWKNGLKMISLLGPKALPATPSVIKLLGKGGDLASNALINIGADALAKIRPLLHHPDPSLRSKALLVIGKTLRKDIHRIDDSLISEMVEAATNEVPEVKYAAIQALGSIGSRAKQALPHILPLLRHPDTGPRKIAVDALDKMNIGPSAALDDLLVLLTKPDEPRDTLEKVILILARLGDQAGPPLMKLASDSDAPAYHRALAVEALSRMDHKDSRVVPLAIALTNRDHSTTNASMRNAVLAIGRLGFDNTESREALKKVFSEGDPLNALDALALLKTKDESFVPLLMNKYQLIGNPRRHSRIFDGERIAILSTLASMGETAHSAAAGLAKGLGKSGESPYIEDTLVSIGAKALPALMESLENGASDTRVAAIDVIGRMKTKGSPALPKLVPLLKSYDEAVKKATLRAIGAIGVKAIPDLVTEIKSGDSQRVFAAVEALQRIKSQSATGVPEYVLDLIEKATETEQTPVGAKTRK